MPKHAPKPPRNPQWIISVSDLRPVGDVARDLVKSGLAHSEVLAEIGCITGSASAQIVAKLRKVRGVTDIALSGPVDVGPPDAPVA